MSGSREFTVATGRLVLSRAELVALAEEVGADRVRGLDGLGLLHVGVDPDVAQAALDHRSLGRAHASVLGSEAAWVRQRLALLRLGRPGSQAVLVLHSHGDRLESHLLAAGGGLAFEVTAVFDRPVSVGPVTTVMADEFVVEDIDPASLGARVRRYARLAPPPDGSEAEPPGPRARVRVVAWGRDGDGDAVRESRRTWLIDDHTDPESIGTGSVSPTEAERELAAVIEEVLT